MNPSIVTHIPTDTPYDLYIKREDLLHPEVSGNKWRKLKYNLIEAKKLNYKKILTYGGAYSNHIAATAAAGRLNNFQTIGVIRGEELSQSKDVSHTLHFAKSCGMQLHYISRKAYRQKEDAHFIEELKTQFGNFYLLPEGGTNKLAVKGCEEIVTELNEHFDYICTAVGTGGTISGIVKASTAHQEILGFSALKGTFQISEIKKYTSKTNVTIVDDYCMGGYAKITPELIHFMNTFKSEHNILLDPVYTAKMMYGIYDMMEHQKFKKNSRILAIHTGGLQGIEGMNQRLKKKNSITIDIE